MHQDATLSYCIELELCAFLPLVYSLIWRVYPAGISHQLYSVNYLHPTDKYHTTSLTSATGDLNELGAQQEKNTSSLLPAISRKAHTLLWVNILLSQKSSGLLRPWAPSLCMWAIRNQGRHKLNSGLQCCVASVTSHTWPCKHNSIQLSCIMLRSDNLPSVLFTVP